jgi:uroporphyrinogen-III synthase
MSCAPGVLVLRPEPGNAATVAAAWQIGMRALGAPLFHIEAVAWTPPDAGNFDAILFGSANALDRGGSELTRYAALPAYAVGQVTAAAARRGGFTVAAAGVCGLAELLPQLVADGRTRVLRLAGEAHVTVAPPAALRIETVVVYAARPRPLSADAAGALGHGAVALLHSAEAARHFADECNRMGIERCTVRLACLGPRIATAAGEGWRESRVAPSPDDRALLALAREMCQTGAHGVTASQNG